MSDGPDFFSLFTGHKLQGGIHSREIKQWLRFFQEESEYQRHLRHYLPLLSEEDRKDFLKDLQDKELQKELSKKVKIEAVEEAPVVEAPAEPTVEVPAEEAPTEEVVEKPKKRSPKK